MSKNKGKQAAPAWDPQAYVKPGVTADEIEEMKEAFDLFDTDSSGAISIAELTSSFKSLGFDVKHSAIFDMIKEIDTDGNQEIDFGEFVELLTFKMSKETPMEDIEKVFKLFDVDRSGEITVDNMMQVARTLGEDETAQDMNDILQASDLDGDGVVTFDDFYSVMTKSSGYERSPEEIAKMEAIQAKQKENAPVNNRTSVQPKSQQDLEVPERKSVRASSNRLIADEPVKSKQGSHLELPEGAKSNRASQRSIGNAGSKPPSQREVSEKPLSQRLIDENRSQRQSQRQIE